MSESRELQPTQQLSPTLQRRMTLVRETYGDRGKFLSTFNPSTQLIAAKNTDRAFFGNAPSLGLLKKAYGDNMPVMFLLPQIYDLCEFTSAKKMSIEQATCLSEIIANEYGYLKASELLLFFYRMKAGHYGKFYGSVDPMAVMVALGEFMKEREQAYSKRSSEERQRERDEMSKNAITLEEYCRSRGVKSFEELLNNEKEDKSESEA